MLLNISSHNSFSQYNILGDRQFYKSSHQAWVHSSRKTHPQTLKRKKKKEKKKRKEKWYISNNRSNNDKHLSTSIDLNKTQRDIHDNFSCFLIGMILPRKTTLLFRPQHLSGYPVYRSAHTHRRGSSCGLHRASRLQVSDFYRCIVAILRFTRHVNPLSLLNRQVIARKVSGLRLPPITGREIQCNGCSGFWRILWTHHIMYLLCHVDTENYYQMIIKCAAPCQELTGD